MTILNELWELRGYDGATNLGGVVANYRGLSVDGVATNQGSK